MTTLNECTECWYVPGELHMVDVIVPETGLTWCMGRDEASVKADHPEAQRMAIEYACEQIDAAVSAKYVKPVSEIREADFNYALDVLPPVSWTSRRGVESFKMSERDCGLITGIFARCGDRYFALADKITLPAEVIAERVGAYIAAHPVANPQERFKL